MKHGRAIGRFDAAPVVALVLYIVPAFVIFGLRLATTSGGSYIGTGVDPQIFIWSFAWWPHALLHGMNPFITLAIWAPDGINLTRGHENARAARQAATRLDEGGSTSRG